jgi:protoporphyrin/coproporphyrin ferrochelatase
MSSTFRTEPPFHHGKAPSGPTTAVLLCNLGTPDEPSAPALRRYLAEFLGDPRVVEIPRLVWLPILHGIILRTRPAKSAAKYASIWTPEGSPLMVWTMRQAKMLQGWLGERGHRVVVRGAMRYGNPGIPAVLDELKAQGVSRVLVLPLYPQYSATTTASVHDAVHRWALQVRGVPEMRFVNHYHDDAGYIDALAQTVQAHWRAEGRPDKLVMSFHGVPKRTLTLGDPYHCECRKTARLLAERLGLSQAQWTATFQSRFGRAEWLQPYTEPTLKELAASGVKRVDVICPGFTGDCLETLEEIAQEAREAFLHAGGQVFHYIPCLNDHPAWITALAHIAGEHLSGWPTQAPPMAAAEVEARQQRARDLGATG